MALSRNERLRLIEIPKRSRLFGSEMTALGEIRNHRLVKFPAGKDGFELSHQY